jgi:putative membrane protein
MKLPFTLAAAAALASTVAVVAPADAQRGSDGPAFVAKAGAGDLYEIQSSQIAVRRARDPRVRAFARMLVTHHRRTTQQVTAAARAAGLRPRPPILEPAQRRMIAELQRAPAGGFDRLYLSQQIPAHQEALGLHQDYSRNGGVATLRRAAAGAVPIVESHLSQARRLQR